MNADTPAAVAVIIVSAMLVISGCLNLFALRSFHQRMTVIDQKYAHIILLLRDRLTIPGGLADNVGIGVSSLDQAESDIAVISDDQECTPPEK